MWRTPSGCSGPTVVAADLDERPDPPRDEVDDAALDLELALDVEQRVAAHDAAQPAPGARPERHVDHAGLVLERQEDRAPWRSSGAGA